MSDADPDSDSDSDADPDPEPDSEPDPDRGPTDEAATLDLPNGETVTTEDVFLYNNYPYRFVPLDHHEYEFKLAPLYWGDSDMDVPFPDREALDEQWGAESRGTLAPEEWEAWLREARHDDRFGDDEVDALARELPTPGGDGLVASIKRALGL